jgi:hypothetical protein
MATQFFTGRASRTAALIAAAALVAGSASPAFAARFDPEGSTAAASSDTAKPQQKSAKKPRQICVQTELTGTRLLRKTCKTREQWLKEDGFDPLEDSGR